MNTVEKIVVRNYGFKVKRSCEQPNGKFIQSASIPKHLLKLFNKCRKKAKSKLIGELIDKFWFEKTIVIGTIEKEEVYNIFDKNRTRRKLKHGDYMFTAYQLTKDQYSKLNKICNYYCISKSSFITLLIESYIKT